jgi:hypothetical protein
LEANGKESNVLISKLQYDEERHIATIGELQEKLSQSEASRSFRQISLY